MECGSGVGSCHRRWSRRLFVAVKRKRVVVGSQSRRVVDGLLRRVVVVDGDVHTQVVDGDEQHGVSDTVTGVHATADDVDV